MNPVALYVSFSGESDKGSSSDVPINNVYGVRADGSALPNVLTLEKAGAPTLHELRGMALRDNTMYVANAYKDATALYVFGPWEPQTSNFAWTSTYATGGATEVEGLWHPYQPAFDSTGNLYVSSQDTFVVTSFATAAGGMTGTTRPIGSHWQADFSGYDLYPGTWAPGFSVGAYPGVTPAESVPLSEGGLATPRGIAVAEGTNRGWLFVADNIVNTSAKSSDQYGNVKVYHLDSGKFEGAIAVGNSESSRPVGLFYDSPSDRLYITAESSNDVHVVQNATVCAGQNNCQTEKIISTSVDGATLDHPSGIVVFTEAANNYDKVIIFVNSRLANTINRYHYHFSSQKVVKADQGFPSGQNVNSEGQFTDTPEQLIAAPGITYADVDVD